MGKKLFCILEQGKYVNHEITLNKKKLYDSEHCDYYRLNWFTDDDPNANWTPKDVGGEKLRFSEGRNLLFEKVPKNYEYYIFMDEDVVLKTYPYNGTNKDDILNTLVKFLTEWKPIGGTIYTSNIWGKNDELLPYMCDNDRPVIARRHDACVGILHESAAKILYPITYHGSDWVTIYQQWVLRELFKDKYLFCPNLYSLNSMEEQHGHVDDRNPNWYNQIVQKFQDNVTEGDYLDYLKHNIVLDVNDLDTTPRKDKIIMTMDDLNTIYDIDNEDFKNTRKYGH